jgi:hypothetical protein
MNCGAFRGVTRLGEANGDDEETRQYPVTSSYEASRLMWPAKA